MAEDYLAKGFADVDAAGAAGAYTDCLALLASLPYYREVKRRSHEILNLRPGMRVLDCGCGLGDDARSIAALVAPGGLAAGVDDSRDILDKARTRAEGKSPCPVFVRADAAHLPFSDRSFHRARIDRTLQHIGDPAAAVRELARVLVPGGILLAYDNDWGCFSLSSAGRRLTRVMLGFWCDSFQSGWAGRFLAGWFGEAGLTDVQVLPSVSVVTDFEQADKIYNIRETVRRVKERGLAGAVEADAWLADLVRQSAEGRFFCSLTGYTVTGRKP